MNVKCALRNYNTGNPQEETVETPAIVYWLSLLVLLGTMFAYAV